ncbi:(A)-specific ribonuclease PARN-like isoform X1 [Octopus vulgaris]|uniref:(A)-specific ribonuclease PARN-like isoform X1 n=2 Tax=Octopus TaxID=6643 RepID=A0AA36BZP9_OCTVU|nr:poly(A)-specific ribonuclease PARN isoform X1 [Octopus sinensis]CAI9743295.1 (A)-specific ribonuclease PARN-like isoform X1 [Octopus vulgaris]
MEVTRKNFYECLDLIQKSIEESDFVAIDGEFTGLDHPDHGQPQPFDTPAERYQKLSKGSVEFLLLQFGLCTFKLNPETQQYETNPFNFYIFPKPFKKESPDQRFLCQSSSIDFLASQGFDFNKVFREGIPYLTPDNEQTLRECLEQKRQLISQHGSSSYFSPLEQKDLEIPADQKVFVDTVCESVQTFVDNSKETVLDLPPCNGFQRKLLYQTLRNKFSNSIHLETKTGERKERFIVVTKISSDEELKKKENEKYSTELTKLDQAVGFSKIIRLISSSGTVVVGHNMLLDIIHILHQFHSPLPQEYEEFKGFLHSQFPNLIDTKLMASTSPFRELVSSSSLGDLLNILQTKPFKTVDYSIPEDFPKYDLENQQLHEAGYDAFITGLCFIGMANYLDKLSSTKYPLFSPLSPLLEPFKNKLFMSRVQDIPYVNVTGNDIQPTRDHIFHVTFPKEWKAADLYQLFMPFGNVQLSWINDTSAYVALHNKDNAGMVLKTLTQAETYRVISYKESKRKKIAISEPQPRKKRPIILDDETNGGNNFTKKFKTLNVDRESSANPRTGSSRPDELKRRLSEESPNDDWTSKESKQPAVQLFEKDDNW